MGLFVEFRRKLAATWTSTNPTVNAGEVGFETDSLKGKFFPAQGTWTSQTSYFNLVPNLNLSDLTSTSTARTNLGLGTIATKAATTGSAVQKADGSGGLTAATAGTDYAAPLFLANMGATTASVTNTVTDTTLWTPANVAAGSLTAGTTAFRIRFGGNFDNAATSGTFTAKVKVNGTTVASVPVAVTQTGAATATTWWADMDVFIDITGGSGAVTAQGYGVQITAAGGARNTIPVLTTTSALSLTGGCQFTLTGQMGTANASNTLRVFRAVINQIA